MTKFNFVDNIETLTISNILNQLLNNIPIEAGLNFLIIGSTVVLPLGNEPNVSYSASVSKKDQVTSQQTLQAAQINGGATIISQRSGDQIRISSEIEFAKFQALFGFGLDNIRVSVVGLIDYAIQFAYANFQSTKCILIDNSGIKGIGDKNLYLENFNRFYDAKNSDKIKVDFSLYFEEPSTDIQTPQNIYQIDEEAVNSALI